MTQNSKNKAPAKPVREQRTVRYGELEIPFTLIQSSRKTYAVSVDGEGEVTVRVPFCASEREIGRLLTERRGWLTQHYSAAKERARERMENSPAARLTQQQRAELEKRYRQAAKEYFPRRADYYRTWTGGSYGKITIRGQKTRWGSCSSSGTLSFNWKLMLAPPAVLDYVVVHELCHLTHMNHGREFWMLVEKVMPDYRIHRRWLREHGAELAW